MRDQTIPHSHVALGNRMMRRNLKLDNEGTSIIFYHNSGPSANTVIFLYCGHPRDRELVSLIARVRDAVNSHLSDTSLLRTPR